MGWGGVGSWRGVGWGGVQGRRGRRQGGRRQGGRRRDGGGEGVGEDREEAILNNRKNYNN